jgi:hypothetical protein
MTMLSIFEPAPVPMLDCGHAVWPDDGPEHEYECLKGLCPFCGQSDEPTLIWVHHNPRGYAHEQAGYCAFQRHMFDVVATCRTCHAYTFGEQCSNRACSNFSEVSRA